jgi:hypothetical protein
MKLVNMPWWDSSYIADLATHFVEQTCHLDMAHQRSLRWSKDISFVSTICAGLSSPRASKMRNSSAANGPSAPLEDPGKSDLKSVDWEREEIGWAAVGLAKFGTRAGRKVDKGCSPSRQRPKRRRRTD